MTARKFICALMIILAFAACAFAAETKSGDIRRDKSGNIIDMKTPAGLRIVYVGTFRAEQPVSPDNNAKRDDGIFSVFMVRADEDMQLKLGIKDGYDVKMNKFTPLSGDEWGYIAEVPTNDEPREIFGEFWVSAVFWHNLPFSLGENPMIARMVFVINDNELTYKRIRPKSWEDWKSIEDVMIDLEENEEEGVFPFDEIASVMAEE